MTARVRYPAAIEAAVKADPLTERETRIVAIIKRSKIGVLGADRIALHLGYRPPRSGRLAVSSTIRSLMRKGVVGRIPPEDQWDHATYFIIPTAAP